MEKQSFIYVTLRNEIFEMSDLSFQTKSVILQSPCRVHLCCFVLVAFDRDNRFSNAKWLVRNNFLQIMFLVSNRISKIIIITKR